MNVSGDNLLNSQQTKSAADCVHRGIDRASEALHATADNTLSSASKLAEKASTGAEKLSATQEKVRAGTVDYASSHPLRSLLISAGIGFLLAKLLGRSR